MSNSDVVFTIVFSRVRGHVKGHIVVFPNKVEDLVVTVLPHPLSASHREHSRFMERLEQARPMIRLDWIGTGSGFRSSSVQNLAGGSPRAPVRDPVSVTSLLITHLIY